MGFSGIPLPRPETSGDRTLRTMSNINSLASGLSNEIANLKKMQIQNEFARPLAESEVMSKSAYAQLAPAQAIATLLSNPQTASMMSPDQYKSLANSFTKMISQPPSYESLLQKKSPTPRSDSFLNKLLNIFSEEEKIPSENELLTSLQSTSVDQYQQPNQISQQQILQSPTLQRANRLIQPEGVMGGINPPSLNKATEEALRTSGTTEAKLSAEELANEEKEARNVALESKNMIDQLNIMEQNYPLLSTLEKGPIAGKLPGYSNAAQSIDAASTNLVTSKLRSWQQGRVTNLDIPLGQMMKPGRHMDNKAFKNQMNFERGFAERNQEYLPFWNKATQLGLSPAQKDIIWMRYINEKPFFNAKNQEINWDNIGLAEDYLTPEKINETFSPGFQKKLSQYKKNMYGGDPKKTQEISNKINESLNMNEKNTEKQSIQQDANNFKNQSIQMISPDGKLYNVPQGKAQLFLDNGFKRYG